MSDAKAKPAHSKSEALIKAASLLGRRPPKDAQQPGARCEWRGDHWRVWIFDGWLDLDDELALISASEELRGSLGE